MKIEDFMAAKKYVDLLEGVEEQQDLLLRLNSAMCKKVYLTVASGGWSVKIELSGDERLAATEKIYDYLCKQKRRIEEALANI